MPIENINEKQKKKKKKLLYYIDKNCFNVLSNKLKKNK